MTRSSGVPGTDARRSKPADILATTMTTPLLARGGRFDRPRGGGILHRPNKGVVLDALDSRLLFERSYETIRPHASYCEERIVRVGSKAQS